MSEWQIAQLARHPERPKALDVIQAIVPDFKELHGDRMYADDTAIVFWIRDNGESITYVHRSGKGSKYEIKNFLGTMECRKPEGYRKAQRLMKLAEKFSMPIVTIIDTPGAYPGIGAEETGAEWGNCQQSLHPSFTQNSHYQSGNR